MSARVLHRVPRLTPRPWSRLAVAFALAQSGRPYVWAGPGGEVDTLSLLDPARWVTAPHLPWWKRVLRAARRWWRR